MIDRTMSDYTAETRVEVHRLSGPMALAAASWWWTTPATNDIFLGAEEALDSIDEHTPCTALRATVRRTVGVVPATLAWTIQARPFE